MDCPILTDLQMDLESIVERYRETASRGRGAIPVTARAYGFETLMIRLPSFKCVRVINGEEASAGLLKARLSTVLYPSSEYNAHWHLLCEYVF